MGLLQSSQSKTKYEPLLETKCTYVAGSKRPSNPLRERSKKSRTTYRETLEGVGGGSGGRGYVALHSSSPKQMFSFLELFFSLHEDEAISRFLQADFCNVLADNFLLAMVYAYFRRANLGADEYTRLNFFAALYLAHDIAEDNEDLKLQIIPWILGKHWNTLLVKDFLNQRDQLLYRMNYRAAVSHQTCYDVMNLTTSSSGAWTRRDLFWGRVRDASHSGTIYFEGPVYTKARKLGRIKCSYCEHAKSVTRRRSDDLMAVKMKCDLKREDKSLVKRVTNVGLRASMLG